ncbi:4-hydroxythreonine-4-phosphate dehydrogenase PdxA [Ammoniphilus sp. YIM 78166]|uniref:4-hydroxythreonine-4-phosphate dehydrogenase PdxA n=1 Tax=Ammoniphilus sp. YIM 78166 TaxID=1644106 RepID=UPI0010702CA0|nr:4-hydroxythreonine-4-phosphate dehydrogenase PdxA [Ammoniphilus sp. YIM 78166]
MYRPMIGITMGDAAGVGPEIIIKALEDPSLYQACRPFVIGDRSILERAKKLVRSEFAILAIESPEDGRFSHGVIDCLDLALVSADLPYGRVSAEAGHAAFSYVKKAVELADAGRIDAICTAPLNKEALHKAGHLYPGHTEILAQLTGTTDYAMLLSSPQLKVIHVTTHIGLIDAVKQITEQRVYTVVALADQALKRSGCEKPRIAVCGINPHAGENGLFGYGEEEEKIVPAVIRAQEEGICVVGPLPADTLFYRAVKGDFDMVVAMYHDQGHGPIKVLGLETGVNITVGLHVIRTSVDHGTAFDIAGTGKADESSLKEAIRQAILLSPKASRLT